MKSITSFFLVLVLFVSSGFIAREKEENLNPEFILPQNEECIADFLLNLKRRINALVFIPEDKVEQARTYNLIPLKLKRAKKANTNFLKLYKNLRMVKPEPLVANDCSESVVYAFENLEMKIFVRKNANLDMGNDVAVTPVPLPMPKPELKANINEFKDKWMRQDAASGLPTGKRQHKPIRINKEIENRNNESEFAGKQDKNINEFEHKVHRNESELAKKDEIMVGFQEENIWKFYVPVRVK